MSVLEITDLPTFILPEEHRQIVATTPESFSTIPAVLRHKEDHVSVTFDPPIHAFSQTSGNDHGTLYVIESCLAFMSTSGRGFKIQYPAITVHAISKGTGGPYVYCQLDDVQAHAPLEDPTEDAFSTMSELVITPESGDSVERIFEAMSKCAALHPDPHSPGDDADDAFLDEDVEDFQPFTGENGEDFSEVGRVRTAFTSENRFTPY